MCPTNNQLKFGHLVEVFLNTTYLHMGNSFFLHIQLFTSESPFFQCDKSISSKQSYELVATVRFHSAISGHGTAFSAHCIYSSGRSAICCCRKCQMLCRHLIMRLPVVLQEEVIRETHEYFVYARVGNSDVMFLCLQAYFSPSSVISMQKSQKQ